MASLLGWFYQGRHIQAVEYLIWCKREFSIFASEIFHVSREHSHKRKGGSYMEPRDFVRRNTLISSDEVFSSVGVYNT